MPKTIMRKLRYMGIKSFSAILDLGLVGRANFSGRSIQAPSVNKPYEPYIQTKLLLAGLWCNPVLSTRFFIGYFPI
jgi:hypothetical protein